MIKELALADVRTISQIQQRYEGYSYDELVQQHQNAQISMIDFIVAQQELFEEFNDYLSRKGVISFTDKQVLEFLREYESTIMDYMQQ